MARSISWTQTDLQRGSLRGLNGVGVVVESLQSDVERDGLTRSLIRTDTELALRQAGIRVLSEEESLNEPGSPYLYVNLSTVKSAVLYAFTSYLYSLQISLRQDVTLTRDTNTKVSAMTWHTSVLGSVDATKLENIRKTLRDSLNKFINDYLAANPK